MKILHFVDTFSQPTETFIKRYVQKSSRFAETGVVAYNIANISGELEKNITLFEIKNRVYTRKTPAGMIRFMGEYFTGINKWYYQLQDVINTFKPDIIHCHFGTMGVAWMNFERKFKKNTPFVTSFYGYDASSLPFTDKHYRRKLNKLWELGTSFFAEGPEMTNKLTRLGCKPDKCLINPLLIPIDEYHVKTVYRKPDDSVKFLFIGRFVEKKGFHLFLSAISSIKKELPDFSVDVIGSGPYQSVYEEIISKYNISANINWLGMKTHAEVINMLRAYDFLVHPSITASDNDSEGGAPTIIIEAQAVGLPVITSDHADIPFVMGYQDFIAKENDLNSLIDAVRKIINCDNIEYYTKLGISKVGELHDLKLNSSYEANLKKLINH